jgi:hypothetical protein
MFLATAIRICPTDVKDMEGISMYKIYQTMDREHDDMIS